MFITPENKKKKSGIKKEKTMKTKITLAFEYIFKAGTFCLKGTSIIFVALILMILSFNSCKKDSIEPSQVQTTDNPTNKALLAGYSLTVTPSVTICNVGSCLYFTITLTYNGVPKSGVSVSVNDPVRQVCAAAGVTNSSGKVTYYCDNMCPAQYNNKYGNFTFSFSASGVTKTCNVFVNLVSPSGYREVSVKNTGNSNYQVQIYVNGVSKGLFPVNAGKTLSLWKDNAFTNSTILANVKNTLGTIIYSATYNWCPTYSAGSSSYVNPTYSNFRVSNTTHTNGSAYSYSFNGLGSTVYNNIANKSVSVGTVGFTLADGTSHGINYNAGGSITGPGCSTFVGLKAGCSIDCSASAGLQLCFGGGAGWAIGPATLGCTASCCLTVANVTCQAVSADLSASAIYQ